MTTESMLRVLIVVGPSTDDGADRRVVALAWALIARGHRVVVAGPAEQAATFSSLDLGVRQVATPIADALSPRLLTVARSLSRWAKGADVVQAHGVQAGAAALSAGAGDGTRRNPVVGCLGRRGRVGDCCRGQTPLTKGDRRTDRRVCWRGAKRWRRRADSLVFRGSLLGQSPSGARHRLTPTGNYHGSPPWPVRT